MPIASLCLGVALLLSASAVAAGFEPIARRIPPHGIELPDKDRTRLESELERLYQRLKGAGSHRLLPDAEVFAKAVDLALRHNEFYDKKHVALADSAIRIANKRLDDLKENRAPWCNAHGLVVRGYRSPIDGSVQPYGLVIPEKLDLNEAVPLYVWLHGRGDKTTDLHFIHQRLTRAGTITPENAIVLHPFGRHCMGFKSAGEIDVLDAINHVASQYKIDRDRIVLMGFSMGGAGCWHLGAHYAERWVAMSPGAGFAETARYNRLKPEDFPPSYEQTLWRLYDVPNYVRNLFNLPVVAYSGELDKQIQAAQVMEEAFASQGKTLPHIIGPGMGHKYHPDSLKQIMRRMDEAVQKGRDQQPKKITLQTSTLRYNKLRWAEILRLNEHWKDSRVDAEVVDGQLEIETKNVAALRLHGWENDPGRRVTIDGQRLFVKDRPPMTPPMILVKGQDGWNWTFFDKPGPEAIESAKADGRVLTFKSHLCQGPIDDAFMAPFLVVTPSGKSKNDRIQKWVEFELEHFRTRWRALYRGELRIKLDSEVTEKDVSNYHLILWGDPDSNSVIEDVVSGLPFNWSVDKLQVNGKQYDAATHVPLLIYPNPKRPRRYVVLNSGPTFREAHDRTNSLQNPKLPDWAVVDTRQPPDAAAPGRVVAADFFDELWQFK